MLGCLWLRAGFVSGNEKQGGVHDRSPVKHGGHEDVVTGTVDERYMPDYTVSENERTKVTARTVIASCDDHTLVARMEGDPLYPICKSGSTPAAGTHHSRTCRSNPIL